MIMLHVAVHDRESEPMEEMARVQGKSPFASAGERVRVLVGVLQMMDERVGSQTVPPVASLESTEALTGVLKKSMV
jgi:hypothetical protein